MRNYIDHFYTNNNLRKQHAAHAQLFAILQKDKNTQEQEFFAYIVTQVQALLARYSQLILLRDIDDTLCYRVHPEHGQSYDVVRKGLYPVLDYLHKHHPDEIDFGILSRRQASFLQETFVQKNNPDRPDTITHHFEAPYIFSSRDYKDHSCPEIYHCDTHADDLANGHHNKANAYHDIASKYPGHKIILIDDIIGFGIKYKAKIDRHIPFPGVLRMGEESVITNI